MFTFFKTNDPYRLIVVFLLLFLIRFSILYAGVPFIIPELKWLLIGERLATGGFIMYRDVWDHTGPLAVAVYHWLFVLFGKSRLALQLVSIGVVIIQIRIFNQMMMKHKAYTSNSYVPALIYMLCMNLFSDFLTLSPVLMGMTFILLVLNNLFKRMDNQVRDEFFIRTGIYLGLATLFFLPAFCYFLITILSLIFYTGTTIRRMLLLVYGYSLVLVFTGLYFHWHDAMSIFQTQYIFSLWNIDSNHYLSTLDFIILTAIPLAIFVVAYLQMKKRGKFINFQAKIQQVMILFFLFGLFAMMWVKESSTYQLIFFVPTVAFVITHYLMTIKNGLVAEASFFLIAIAILLNHLLISHHWVHLSKVVNLDQLTVEETVYSPILANKRIVVFGKNISHYHGTQLATPYLNWQLSALQISATDSLNVGILFDQLKSDRPEVIVDQQNVMPRIFTTIPAIARYYIRHEKYAEIYLLTNDFK